MAAPGRKKGPAPKPRTRPAATRAPATAAGTAAPARTPPVAPSPAAPRNGFGTTALVLGLLAMVGTLTPAFGVVLGVPAIVFGFLARRRVKNGEATNGRSAFLGIVLGAVAVLVVAALLIYAQIVFGTPAGKRYTDCLDRAPDKAAREVCEDVFERER